MAAPKRPTAKAPVAYVRRRAKRVGVRRALRVTLLDSYAQQLERWAVSDHTTPSEVVMDLVDDRRRRRSAEGSVDTDAA